MKYINRIYIYPLALFVLLINACSLEKPWEINLNSLDGELFFGSKKSKIKTKEILIEGNNLSFEFIQLNTERSTRAACTDYNLHTSVGCYEKAKMNFEVYCYNEIPSKVILNLLVEKLSFYNDSSFLELKINNENIKFYHHFIGFEGVGLPGGFTRILVLTPVEKSNEIDRIYYTLPKRSVYIFKSKITNESVKISSPKSDFSNPFYDGMYIKNAISNFIQFDNSVIIGDSTFIGN